MTQSHTRPLSIAVIGTFDTKGHEHQFVAEQIRARGHRALLIDVGTAGTPTIEADLSRESILSRIDGGQVSTDRGQAIEQMTSVAPLILRELYDQGQIDGVIGLGGSCGTSIVTAAMRGLPLGIPKVMVSTLASGHVARYVDVSDITMMPAIVDVSGLNRISESIFIKAAAAVVAMAEAHANMPSQSHTKPLVVASMFGNTTRCIEQARPLIEAAGYEMIVFHATGVGGRSMEAIIASGLIAGVLDVTTTEWADQLVGGVMPGGPQRLSAAALGGVPAVVAPGCLDMVNFGEPSSIPDRFKSRLLYQHNPQVTLMRTTPEECAQLGRILASQLNQSTGPVHVLFPLQAISVISAPGGAFHDPAADEALRMNWQSNLRADIPFETLDCQINDAMFAEHAARVLLGLMSSSRGNGVPSGTTSMS